MRHRLMLAALLTALPAMAQRGPGPGPGPGVVPGVGQNPPLASLKTVAPPAPLGAERYVADETKLIALRK